MSNLNGIANILAPVTSPDYSAHVDAFARAGTPKRQKNTFTATTNVLVVSDLHALRRSLVRRGKYPYAGKEARKKSDCPA